jgi:RimJ/RimL family protein N-acetyltransferase
MAVTFKPLNESHFPLLLKWLEKPHVKKWWDQDVTYTMDLVREKYNSYVKGYKFVDGIQKAIQAFIIYRNQNPVGYIQIYNAYDFPRSKPFSGLPVNLGAFDIFIGEQEILLQGVGSQAIAECLSLHGNRYSHIFADPDKNNVAAIKCYEKAGFKKVSEHEETRETWMLKDLSSRNEPLPTIQKLIKERYPDAKAVFWAGSVSEDRGTSTSDLDLVIIFEELAYAYREAFIYDGWPIDAFIHNLDTLRYFCKKLEASDGKPALINMILQGKEMLAQNSVSMEAEAIADSALAKGPDSWTKGQINKERFHITDIMDDIESPKNKEEQILSAVHLFEPLLQYYFRSQKKWTASGKSLIRLLKAENPKLAEEWIAAFESLVQTGDATSIKTVVTQILAPQGGYLWDGFRSDAPAEWKVFDQKK